MTYIYVLVTLQAAGTGIILWALQKRLAAVELETLDLRSRLARPEARTEALHVDEWWRGYYAAPEGSPRREAFEARLRSAGVF